MGDLCYGEGKDVPVHLLRALYEDVGWTTVTARSDAVLAASIAGASVVHTCWDGRRLVGIFRAISDGARCAHILDLAVAGAYQHRGVGGELFRRGMADLAECDYVSLLTEGRHVGFYERHGMFHHRDAMLLRREVDDAASR
jgi:ribosomal protein S18 acetylase RimI-like enzyme